MASGTNPSVRGKDGASRLGRQRRIGWIDIGCIDALRPLGPPPGRPALSAIPGVARDLIDDDFV
jgi:hypothetical protein